MPQRSDWARFKAVLDKYNIKKLYHFTDRENLESIIANGGLFSWDDCEKNGIQIKRPGGGLLSRDLDREKNLQSYVRVSFTREHPMMYVAMNDGRIANPVILEIDPTIMAQTTSLFADRNATKRGALIGNTFEDFYRIHFPTVIANKHFNVSEDERPYYQAEVLIKNKIPLEAITNIGNFGISIPSKPKQIQSREAYTAQITRSTPTAFIFMIDHSVSMRRTTVLNGETVTLAEAVARIVNQQINELVLRCVKNNEVRHYYDIAVIGYGENAYYGWNGELEGRGFVSPEELVQHPYKTITIREEKKTRRGPVIKEVQKTQWVEACHTGHWTHLHKAFDLAKELLDEWMEKYGTKNCYPPTIINITDGQFNGTTRDDLLQQANEIKSEFTNDGNVLLWNIHVTPDTGEKLLFPVSKAELGNNEYAKLLFDMSSLLPPRYANDVAQLRNVTDDKRFVAMATNTEMSTLIQLMDIGTPTNIVASK